MSMPDVEILSDEWFLQFTDSLVDLREVAASALEWAAGELGCQPTISEEAMRLRDVAEEIRDGRDS